MDWIEDRKSSFRNGTLRMNRMTIAWITHFFNKLDEKQWGCVQLNGDGWFVFCSDRIESASDEISKLMSVCGMYGRDSLSPKFTREQWEKITELDSDIHVFANDDQMQLVAKRDNSIVQIDAEMVER